MQLGTDGASVTKGAPMSALPSSYVWIISVIAALGGLLFGYDWVVIGGAKPFFEPFFHIGPKTSLEGWVNSCALLGCLVGALCAGVVSDRLGRKKPLVFAAVLFAVTSLGNALAPNLVIFVLWRILGGVAIGLSSSLSPMYISEVAPARLRGRLVSINQLTIVVGILMAQVINWFIGRHLPEGASVEFIRTSWYGEDAWRWMFAITAIPSLLFFFGLFVVPESPRWLIKHGSKDAAEKVLAQIGGPEYAETEVANVSSTISAEEVNKVNFGDLLAPGLRKVLVLGIVLAVFQQWCGINVVFNYAEDIFRAAGYDISSVLMNIAFTGCMNLVFTFVALGVVDFGGRRPLMLLGSGGLAVIYLLLGGCYFFHIHGLPDLILVLAAIGCYASSLAPITWVIISEIFPNRIRGAAIAIAVTALWAACFVLTYTFPILLGKLGESGTFWLYAAICVAGFVFILKMLPETKGKSLEAIEKELVG